MSWFDVRDADKHDPAIDSSEVRSLKARIEQLIQVNNADLERRRTAERERDRLFRLLTVYCANVEDVMSLDVLLMVKREWSLSVFGPDYTYGELLAHIRKEVAEVAANPNDTTEWIDIILLAMDGYWRANDRTSRAQNLMRDLAAKVEENKYRQWERSAPGEPMEHKRESTLWTDGRGNVSNHKTVTCDQKYRPESEESRKRRSSYCTCKVVRGGYPHDDDCIAWKRDLGH